MKNVRTSLLLALSILTLVLLTNCSDDDPQMEEQVDLSDPNAIAEVVTVTGATVVEGTPPAPSSDPSAPQIEEESDILSVQGNEIGIDLDVTNGNVAGVYLQVKGADSYLDIPASSFGGRVAQTNDPNFNLQIPDNIEPGEFCVELCVYDSDAQVSNIVEICITVEELGGENSEFLPGIWDVTRIEDEYDGMTEVEIIGEPNTYTYETQIVCSDGQTYENVQITETSTFDYLRITFAENGALRFESSYEESFLDWENSTCENLIYITETGMDDADGAWSYQDATKRLVLIINEEDENGDVDQDAIELVISVDGNTMTAVQDFGDGEISTVTLVKQ